MTVANGFKRLGLVLAAALLAVGGAALAMSLLISSEGVRERAKAELTAATGFKPVFKGASSVSLFPSGTVSFSDVSLGDGPQPALTAERLVARLQFFPLLIGKVMIADITLEQPRIALNFTADGHSNWSNLMSTIEQGQKPGGGTASLSEILINNGIVVVRDESRGISEQFDHVELSLAWPLISKSFGTTGRFFWRGEPLDASLTLSDFSAALAGNRTGVKLRISGAPLKAAFDGAVSLRPALKLEGTLAADTSSLRDSLTWTGQKPLPGGGFGRFALKAQTNVVGGTIALSGVNVELDGNSAEGVLTFATDGRQTLQGTLAAETLDLTPYVTTVRLLASSQREWNNARISLDGLTGFDVDLRLSAANVVMSNAKVGRTALGANLRGGHLTVTVGESQAFGGIVKGSFSLANFETGVDIKSQMQFTGVDLTTCLGQMFGMRHLDGKGNLAVALEGSGDSILALTRTLTGTASLTSQQGALVGFNVEQLLRRKERRPLSDGGEFRTGRTAYDKLGLILQVSKGVASIVDAKIEGKSVRLTLEGAAGIPARDLNMKGTAALYPNGAQNASFELPFFVEGSWDNPIVLPDPQILIRRSGAAAPLLDAVRDRSARDAVRSAIERLTGGLPATGTTTPSAPAFTSEPAKPGQ